MPRIVYIHYMYSALDKTREQMVIYVALNVKMQSHSAR